jgi:hypothetical protein
MTYISDNPKIAIFTGVINSIKDNKGKLKYKDSRLIHIIALNCG